MKHSIVIPHRNRNRHLDVCLWSIMSSIEEVDTSGVEIIVVDNASDVRPEPCDGLIRVIHDDRPMPTVTITTRLGVTKTIEHAFSKARLLNVGIEAAKGDIVTIMDADAIVGRMWTSGATMLAKTNIHRVAYRVRYVERGEAADLFGSHPTWPETVAGWFAKYDDHRLAWEAYGLPEKTFSRGGQLRDVPAGLQPWGNSQFSMRRDDIGDLRFYEDYVGKGLEDIDFNCQVHRKFGDAFRGVIYTNPEFAMLHLCHDYDEAHWSDPALQIANADRFNGRFRCFTHH